MTIEEFENIRNDIFNNCKKLTKTKGEDYTKGNKDVLINFKEGDFLGLNSYQKLGVFMSKHIDAIYNYIKTGGEHESEPIETRIQDCINYLIFLYALTKENNNK